MRAKVLTMAAAGLLSLLGACSEGGNAAGPAPTTEPSEPTGTSASAPADADGCPVGEYEVTKITGRSGVQVNGIPITATSGGGLKLALTDAGTWTLTGQGADITLKAGDLTVEATVDGTAEGNYAKSGGNYLFRQDGATGKVTLKRPVANTSSIPMADVGPALAPGGTAQLTCTASGLTIGSDSVELELNRVGGGSGGGPATPTAPTGTGSSGGGPLTISESALTRTIDCAGSDVSINGSANKLTFTGSCGSVAVNGSRNTITLATAGAINVNGSFNTVTWSSGNPTVSNNGTGNKISQG